MATNQYSLSNLINRISNHDKLCKHKTINMSPFQIFLHISKLWNEPFFFITCSNKTNAHLFWKNFQKQSMHWVIQNGIERRKDLCIRGRWRWNLCFFWAWLHQVLSQKLAAVTVLVQFSDACEQHHWTSYFKKSQSVRAVGSSYCLLLGDVESLMPSPSSTNGCYMYLILWENLL